MVISPEVAVKNANQWDRPCQNPISKLKRMNLKCNVAKNLLQIMYTVSTFPVSSGLGVVLRGNIPQKGEPRGGGCSERVQYPGNRHPSHENSISRISFWISLQNLEILEWRLQLGLHAAKEIAQGYFKGVWHWIDQRNSFVITRFLSRFLNF